MPKSEEQCRQMRDDMRQRIIKESSLYFAKNGFGDTKISDLAKYIGIGQGTIYLYFKSKEELFEQIREAADNETEVKHMKMLVKLPVPAKTKIEKLSEHMVKVLKQDDEFAVKITLYTQLLLENDEGPNSSEIYKELAKLIRQGQKEGSVVKGDALYLADLYWGQVYLCALKKLFVKGYRTITKESLCRILEA